MSFARQIRHYFTPHATNNFRAQLLHNAGIFFFVGIIALGNLMVKVLESSPLHILGFASSITINEVVTETNAERIKSGLSPLAYSEKLADAARRKAANMLAEDYWAHNAPSGKTPWVWFKDAGYNYLYAGENLAKDFGSTDRMIAAWMASPTHRDNIVSSKYQEIGVAVVPGTLQGKETMLVVQLFGTPASGSVAPAVVASPRPTATPAPTIVPATTIPEVVEVAEVRSATLPVTPAASPEVSVVKPIMGEMTFRKLLTLSTMLLFMLVLILDLFIAESQVISRRVGKNWAHLLFINVILLVTTMVNVGTVL